MDPFISLIIKAKLAHYESMRDTAMPRPSTPALLDRIRTLFRRAPETPKPAGSSAHMILKQAGKPNG